MMPLISSSGQSGTFRCRGNPFSPLCPEQCVRNDEEEVTQERRQQVEEVAIANDEVNTDGEAEAGAPHNADDLGKTAINIGTPCHEEEKTAYGTESATESCAVM